jgi:hypothetical protein
MWEMTIMDTSVARRTGGPQDRKTGQSEMSSRTIQFPRRQQLFLVINASKGCREMDLLLMNQEAVRIRQGRRVRLRLMMKQSPTWGKVQKRWQQSKTGPWR